MSAVPSGIAAATSSQPVCDPGCRHPAGLSQPFPWYFSGRFIAEGLRATSNHVCVGQIHLGCYEDPSHERQLSIGAVSRGHVRCKVCLAAELEKSAAKHGLTLLGVGRTANYRRYRFNDCGHERELSPGSVRRGVVFCRKCLERSLAEEAHKSGIEIIGRGVKPHYRRYRFISCGQEQDMQPIHVRLEGFHCQTCNESAWEGDGNVYIVALTRGDDIIYKVGLAKSVAGRITRYGLKNDVDVDITATWQYKKFRDAHRAEQSLHAALAKAGLRVPQEISRRYLRSGFTECYTDVPYSLLQHLLTATAKPC